MALVVAIFTMALLLVAGVFLVRMSSTEGDIAYNAMWSEGSFFAAEAAINVGLDQVTPTNTSPLPRALAPPPPSLDPFTASGTVRFTGTSRLPGYSIGVGTGYNPGGFAFYTYSVTGSGTGPRSTRRQIDVQAAYGPVAE